MSGDPQSVDAVVLGAGAAGLMCAIAAGRRGRRVAVLDHARKLGTKILISGGGRCNFTNLEIAPERFLSRNPQFARSALGRFTQWDFIGLVEAHGIAWHEKTLGQLFCDGSAREILDLLLAECRDAGVRVVPGAPVREVARAPEAGGGFTVRSEAGTWSAPRLVLATGGPSIPKTGATGFAYELARQFGLGLVEPRPGLVPLTLDAEQLELARPLSGVAVDSVASYGKAAFREATLFTHRGVSGPAILQVSSYWQAGADARGREGRAGESRDRDATVRLDLLPAADADWLVGRKRDRPKIALATALAEALPQRLAQRLVEQGALGDGLAGTPLAELKDARLRQIAARLKDWQVRPAGTEGFAKAEVALGGVDTAALEQKTLEAKAVPGLHVIGEAVDVTGWLGGYNFQWAWSSGWAAGQAL